MSAQTPAPQPAPQEFMPGTVVTEFTLIAEDLFKRLKTISNKGWFVARLSGADYKDLVRGKKRLKNIAAFYCEALEGKIKTGPNESLVSIDKQNRSIAFKFVPHDADSASAAGINIPQTQDSGVEWPTQPETVRISSDKIEHTGPTMSDAVIVANLKTAAKVWGRRRGIKLNTDDRALAIRYAALGLAHGIKIKTDLDRDGRREAKALAEKIRAARQNVAINGAQLAPSKGFFGRLSEKIRGRRRPSLSSPTTPPTVAPSPSPPPAAATP